MNTHLNRKVWLSEAAGTDTSGGGSGMPTAGAVSTTSTTDPADTGSTTTTVTERLHTQADVDRMIEARLARERAKVPANLDELRARAARADELEAQMGTESEKAVRNAVKETEKTVATKYEGMLRAAAVREAAATLGFHDAGDALAQLSTSGVLSGIKVSEDGNVDNAAVKRELESLAAAKPYLLAKKDDAPPPARDAGIGATGDKGADRKITVQPGLARMRLAYGESQAGQQ